MKGVRPAIWVGAIAAAVNIAVFLVLAHTYLNVIHHHWIVPVFCGWLFIQCLVASTWRGYHRDGWTTVVLGLAAVTGALLFWRQFSMFQCFRHCEGRLTVGLILLAGAFSAAKGAPAGRWARWTAAFFLLWAAVVGAVGLIRGTWNFS